MITLLSILGLGAIGNRVVHLAKTHGKSIPHSGFEELECFVFQLAVNTGVFIVFYFLLILLF